MKLFVGLILSAFVLQALALPAFEDMSKPEHLPVFEDMNMPEHQVFEDMSKPEHLPVVEDMSKPEHLPVVEDMSKPEHLPVVEDMSKPEHLPVFEDMSKPEHIPRNEIVDAFREEIDRHFVRYQVFYDRTNAAMRDYRLEHVRLVSRIYNALMVVFGDSIEEVRMATYDLIDMLNRRMEELGGNNQCLNNIVARSVVNSEAVGGLIQACALRANTTLSDLLTNTFYPTFAAIQTETSTIPISVIDILSRGNVLEDEESILQYLEDRYEVIQLQWLGGVSQLLRWETNRFESDGLFLVDEMTICMENATWQFLLDNSALEGEVGQCE